jgi:uncharacterized protein YndB with AHSA1/START domain
MGDDDLLEDSIELERVLDASIERVWRMWTDPACFASWYGPDGATVPDLEIDLRVGGVRRVCMEVATPAGPRRMWFVGEHLEVEPPRRLVYTEAMSDEHGEPLSPSGAGLPDDHPVTTEVVVELVEVDGSTRMQMTHRGLPVDSPGAAGWDMAFDKLAAEL